MSNAAEFDAVELIRLKRDGGRLNPAEIDWLIRAYTDGVVSDEQMSAMAMAIFFRGLERDELSRWTAAMIATGERAFDHAFMGQKVYGRDMVVEA